MNKVRRIAGERSVGHLGTLDPLATGVLPLLLGSATRLARFYGQADKVYQARVRFGFATDTYDAEGDRTTEEKTVSVTRDQLGPAIATFQGRTRQIPPQFSAKKVAGVPAYKLARAKKSVELAPVEVEVFAIELVELALNEIVLRIHCSSGTYVRAIAHDLGILLGCGAHLAALRRLRSGAFSIEQSYTLPGLEKMQSEDRLAEAIIDAATLLPEIPAVITDSITTAQIRNGRNFHTSPFLVRSSSQFVRALTESGSLLAIGEAVLPNVYHPVVVLA